MEIWIDDNDSIYVAGASSSEQAAKDALTYLEETGSWDSYEDLETVAELEEGFKNATPRWWDMDYLNANDIELVPDFCISTSPKDGWQMVLKVDL